MMGTKTYLQEKICFCLIHTNTFFLADPFLYKQNHKQSRYVQELFFSLETFIHKFLHEKECIISLFFGGHQYNLLLAMVAFWEQELTPSMTQTS